jgi:hypothetical protein
MTAPAGQDAPAADVAMPAADAPTVEVTVEPSAAVPQTTTIAAPVAADVTVNPTTPVRTQVFADVRSKIGGTDGGITWRHTGGADAVVPSGTGAETPKTRTTTW